MDIQKRFTDRVSPAIIKPQITLPFEPNLNAYKAWEDELPVLNPKISDQQFSEANAALLAADIDATDKFEIADETQNCLARLLSVCKTAIEGAKLPLREEQAEISSELLSVLNNSSAIYIDIIRSADFLDVQQIDDEAARVPLFTEQQRGLVIFRAIELLASSQLLMATIYKSPEATFWG